MINPFKRTYDQEELNMFRFLGRIKLFQKLNFEEMALFIPYLHAREYKNNEVVFFRNDPSQALYVIKKGKVSIELDLKDRFESIGVLENGEAFGDNSLLVKRRRLFSAIIISEGAMIYVIPQVNIHDIFARKPQIKAKMMEALAEHNDEQIYRLLKSYKTTAGFSDIQAINLK